MYRLTLTRGLVNGLMEWHGGGGSAAYAVGSRALSKLQRSQASTVSLEVDGPELGELYGLARQIVLEVERQRKAGIRGEAGPKDVRFAEALRKRLQAAERRDLSSSKNPGRKTRRPPVRRLNAAGRTRPVGRRKGRMTKADVLAAFKAEMLPDLQRRYEQDGRPDWPARRQGWNNVLDYFLREGSLTPTQVDRWSTPAIVDGRKRPTRQRNASVRRRRNASSTLRSARPAAAVGKSVAKAFRAIYGSVYGQPEAVYEHGHWWILTGSGAEFDAVDASGPDTADGWGFERVT